MHLDRITLVLDVVGQCEIDKEWTCQQLVGKRVRFTKRFECLCIFKRSFELRDTHFTIVCRMGILFNPPFKVEDVDCFEIRSITICTSICSDDFENM